jgi:hypothetical protein
MRASLCYDLISSAERNKREREREKNKKQYVEEAHSVLITAILLPQRLSCYWGKIVSLRMLTNLRLADLRLSTAQQRSTGQNLLSDLYTLKSQDKNPRSQQSVNILYCVLSKITTCFGLRKRPSSGDYHVIENIKKKVTLTSRTNVYRAVQCTSCHGENCSRNSRKWTLW